MNTAPAPASRTAPAAAAGPSRVLLLAGLAVGIAAVLSAVAVFAEIGNTDGDQGLTEFFIVLGMICVATAIVFGTVVRTAVTGDAARRSLVLGILAVLTGVVFWTGLPPVLALGAIGCALVARDQQGRWPTAAGVGTGLAGLALAAAVVLAVIG